MEGMEESLKLATEIWMKVDFAGFENVGLASDYTRLIGICMKEITIRQRFLHITEAADITGLTGYTWDQLVERTLKLATDSSAPVVKRRVNALTLSDFLYYGAKDDRNLLASYVNHGVLRETSYLLSEIMIDSGCATIDTVLGPMTTDAIQIMFFALLKLARTLGGTLEEAVVRQAIAENWLENTSCWTVSWSTNRLMTQTPHISNRQGMYLCLLCSGSVSSRSAC